MRRRRSTTSRRQRRVQRVAAEVIREAWRRYVERGDRAMLDDAIALVKEQVALDRARDHRRRPRPEWVKSKIAAAQRARARRGAIARSRSTGRFERA